MIVTEHERQMNDMKCFFCKGNMSDGFMTHVVDLGKSVIVVRGVPCEKCDQCGETVFTGTIAKQLENIVDRLKNSFTVIVIVNFTDKVA